MKLCAVCEWRPAKVAGRCVSDYWFRRRHGRDRTEHEVIVAGQKALEDLRSYKRVGSIRIRCAEVRLGDGMGEHTAAEIVREVGISYRCLDYWARIGLVTPSVRPAEGSGTQRLYSESDLQRLVVVNMLRESGISLEEIRKVLAAPARLNELESTVRDAHGLLVAVA